MNNNLKIFSGDANVPLAMNICQNLNVPLGSMKSKIFPSREHYIQFGENIRGSDVFLIQGTDGDTNNNLMQLLVMVDAARRASAERVTAVIPVLPYQRQEKKCKSREAISAKLVLNLLEAAGVNRILTMDLHAPQICAYTDLPFDHLLFEPVIKKYLNERFKTKNNLIVMAPDIGAAKRAESYANALECDLGMISKRRINEEKVELIGFIGDVLNKTVILIDDITESASTLIQAAKACKERGAAYVICIVTHFAITQTGAVNLSYHMQLEGDTKPKTIDEFIHSNTIDTKLYNNNKGFTKPVNLMEIDVSPLFSQAINNIHNNESISKLFE